MHISIGLGLGDSWCQIAIYPFSWLMFVQNAEDGPTNIGLGPLRLTFN